MSEYGREWERARQRMEGVKRRVETLCDRTKPKTLTELVMFIDALQKLREEWDLAEAGRRNVQGSDQTR